MLPRFFNGAFDDFRALGEFAPYVDVSRARIERVTRYQHSFQHLMRVLMKNVTVLESSRFGLVGVADQINRPLFVQLDEAPFQTAGEASSAAVAQARVLDLVDDVAERHCLRCRALFVSAGAQVTIDTWRPICASDVLVNQTVFERVRRPLMFDVRPGESVRRRT